MVRPTLEYASTCWDPHSKDLIEDIEQVQKRAARFVYNNYRSKEPGCVTNMLETLNWVGFVSDVVDVCVPSEIFTYGNA
jgi:hypothetical protein